MTRPLSLLIAAVFAIAGITGTTALAASAGSKATVKTGTSSLGRIVVDGKSHSLYLFMKDKGGKSSCSGECAQDWPPLLTKGKPKAGAGVKASLLGTTKRSDGTTQVTYNKHPLYTFVLDNGKRGSTKGQGINEFGGLWYTVAAKGTAKKGGY